MTQAFNDSWGEPVTPRETATALAWKDGYDTARAAYDKVFAEHRAAIVALPPSIESTDPFTVGLDGSWVRRADVLAILDGDRA